MSTIILKAEHRRAIARHGEEKYPQECRGLLLGHNNGMTKQVVDLMFIGEAVPPESDIYRYQIPSQHMREGQELAQAKGLEVIGSFHSHVDQPARPSVFAREHVEPAFSFVIVGVRQGRAHELAAWELSDDGTAFFQIDIRSA